MFREISLTTFLWLFMGVGAMFAPVEIGLAQTTSTGLVPTTDNSLLNTPPETPAKPEAPATPETPPKPEASAKLALVVEDRWPVSEIQIGQRVAVVPITIGKTSLSASYFAIAVAVQPSSLLRVTSLEPMADCQGRRVGLEMAALPVKDSLEMTKFFQELVRSASTNCVLPIEDVSLTDFRWMDTIYEAIEPTRRPSAEEVHVGENFILTGLHGAKLLEKQGSQDVGPFKLTYLDDDGPGFWNVRAYKTGMARFVQLPHFEVSELSAHIRRSEFLVKVDTRELELHLKREFPNAKLSITSIGADALLLHGSVQSQQEKQFVVELAELYFANILNRLKVMEPASKVSETAPATLPSVEVTEVGIPLQVSPILSPQVLKDGTLGTAELELSFESVFAPEQDTRASWKSKVRLASESTEPSTNASSTKKESAGLRNPGAPASQILPPVVRKSATPVRAAPIVLAPETKATDVADEVIAESTEEGQTQGSPQGLADEVQQIRDDLQGLRNQVGELQRRLDILTSSESAKTPGTSAVTHTDSDREVAALILEFNRLLQQKRYTDAEALAKRAQEIDPENLAGQRLKLKALLARRLVEKQAGQADSALPPAGTTVKDVVPLTDRRRPLFVGATEKSGQLQRKLNEVVSISVHDSPLLKAIEKLSQATSVNIVFDQAALKSVDVSENAPITIEVTDITLRNTLKLMLTPLKLSYVVDGEVIRITTPPTIVAPSVVVVAYPVADLLSPNEAPDVGLVNLVQLIGGVVGPEAWKVRGSQIVHNVSTKSIFVRQTPDVQGEIYDFLEMMRRSVQDSGSTDAMDASAGGVEREQKLALQLQKPIDLLFDEVPLEEVLNQIQKQIGTTISFNTTTIEDPTRIRKIPVTIHLREVTIEKALQLVLEPLDLDYIVKRFELQVTTRAQAAATALIATYNVSDLLKPQMAPSEMERLIKLIQTMVEPGSWDDAGGKSTIRGNMALCTLVVRQTRANHARIRELLEALQTLK